MTHKDFEGNFTTNYCIIIKPILYNIKNTIHEQDIFQQKIAMFAKIVFNSESIMKMGNYIIIPTDVNLFKKNELLKNFIEIYHKTLNEYVYFKVIYGKYYSGFVNDSFMMLDHISHIKKDEILDILKAKIDMENSLFKDLTVINIIKDSIDKNKILPYLQAIIDNKTGKIAKHEMLSRILHNGKIYTPIEFLELSKNHNLYYDITKETVKNVIRIIKYINTPVSINLSLSDVTNPILSNLILEAIHTHKCLQDNLIIEILEDEELIQSCIYSDFRKEMKKYNVKIAIDDFGSGFSNLERISALKPDIIKIDGSIVKGIIGENSKWNKGIIKSLVSFSKEVGIETVAEYVYNEEVFKEIKKLNVDYSQGYFIQKPCEFVFD